MTNSKRRTLPAVVAGAIGFGALATFAGATELSPQEQIKTLEAKVAALEAASAPKMAQMNAAIESVLRDANTHSQLLAAGSSMSTSAYDPMVGGLPIVSADGFTLKAGVGMQFTYAANWGEDRKHGTDNDIQTGFEVTRARVALSGSAIDPGLTYYFQWDAGDLNGGVALLDAMVKWNLSDNLALILGQFKDPVYHEELVDWSNQLGAQRSMTLQLLGTPDGTGSRVQGAGLAIGRPSDQIHGTVVFHDGRGSANTSFQDAGSYWGAAGRIEFIASGRPSDYMDFTARNTEGTLLVIGAGADMTQGANFNSYVFTVDAQYEVRNLSLYGAFLGNVLDPRNALGDDTTFNWGLLVQAGFDITNQFEIYGRVDWTHFENDQVGGDNNFYEISVGANYYLFPNSAAFNRAKVTVDLTWLPNGCPAALPYQHILGGTNDNEIVLSGTFTLAL